MPASSTRASRRPTPWSRRPSCSAATPASPTSRAPSSPTGTRASERLTVYHGTQAPHMMQNLFAKHLGLAGAPGARRHQGCRRLVRHQGAHLCRRDGDGRAVEAAQAADQVRRRPDRELRHRHPRPRPPRQGEDRRQERRHHHRLGDRRSHRHRPLLGLSAHLRHRGEPDRQPHRRALHLPELSRPRARRVPEQERDVPVPRGRPSDRDRGDRRPGRAGGRAGSAWTRWRSARRNLIPDDAYPCQRPVRHQVRGAVAPRGARPSRRHDELRRAARRAEAPARARHLSRHRLCLLHRGDQSERRLLRRRRREDLRAGRRHRAARRAGRDHLPDRRHRAGPGRRSRDRAGRGLRLRRADRERARHHRATPTTRPMAAAPGPRARPASAAKPPGRPARRCAPTCSPAPASILQAKPEDLDIRDGVVVDRGSGTERICLCTNSRASPISVPTRCRPASRPS